MNDINQAILISAISVVTILFAIIGIQVALIFREFRRTIEKFNKILDDAGKMSGKVTKSVEELSGVTSGIKAALGILRFFKPKSKRKEKKEE